MSGQERVSDKLRDFYRRLRDEERAKHALYPRDRLGITTKAAPRFPKKPTPDDRR